MLQKTTKSLLSLIYMAIALSGVSYADQTAHKATYFSTSLISKSDSPILFLRDNELSIKPLSAPSISEFMVKTNETVIYDFISKEEELIANNKQYDITKSLRVLEPFEGLLASSLLSSSARVLGADGRKRITNTTDYPWRTIAKLIITFPDGGTNSCSGAIIGNFHVLTAGHCVYSRGHGGYGKIKVYPGQDGSYTPFSYANSTKVRTYTQWTTNRDPNHDWALITLDRNIGLYTGWMGLKTASSISSVYKASLNVSGYPVDRKKGTLWNSSEKGHSANAYRHFYTMDTAGGQSGAPVWRLDGGDRYILSVHAYADSAATPGITNAGTRITSNKYNKIRQWRASDSVPRDKPDLIDDGNAYSSFSPSKISAGKTLSVKSDVRNIGTANSGTFYVSYFASKDTTISTGDYYLGKVRVSSISPFSKADANWRGTFPSNIPAGTYFIGWIIDSTKLKKEFSETNNTGYKQSPKLIVNGGTGGSSTSVLISPSGTTKDNTPTYKWKAVSGATYYQLRVNDSTGNKIMRWYTSASVGCRSGSGNCSITPKTVLANGNGTWKIRTWSNRKYGAWTAPKAFKVAKGGSSSSSTAVTLISPSGTTKDNTPTYKWKAVSGASYYQLRVNDSTGNKIMRWYTSASVGCRSGSGNCSITPSTALANGNGTWKIRTWSNRKYGAWSAPKSFKVAKGGSSSSSSTTTAVTLISPSGTIKDNTPTYKWKAVSGASYYQLRVNDSTGNKIMRWYTSASVGCRSGSGNCSITPNTALANGNGTWKIRTWSNRKYGAWSAPKSFKVAKGGSSSSSTTAVTLISPSGTIKDNTPTYKWKAISGATYYYLWVNDSRGYKVRTWYSANALGCRTGGTCSITPYNRIANGRGSWKVRAWRSGRYTPWTKTMTFNKH